MFERILIVDDSKFSRNNIRKNLEKHNYNIVGEAIDGLDGIEKFKELSPDFVIADIEMPVLNGLEMIKLMKALVPDIDVLVVSTVANTQVIKGVEALGCIVIQKPIRDNQLDDMIKKIK